eukprot:TRINITY_DN435_c0_g1_i1.p1 TRINITY_DN435_c0_g1~~TRINITY_DN435_c0_g1_i1.p1  ORF type:complete len:179 (-),score=23.40 TRINITY_DN435_c0_g1_i1:2165-2701(-)
MNPSDGKCLQFLTATPSYPEFAPTYKWYHVHKICTCCGLFGHLVPTCPLHHIFITEDIRIITHTDPNPATPCRDETFEGEIIIPDIPPPSILPLQHDTESDEISMDNTPTEELLPPARDQSNSTTAILKPTGNKKKRVKPKPSTTYKTPIKMKVPINPDFSTKLNIKHQNQNNIISTV